MPLSFFMGGPSRRSLANLSFIKLAQRVAAQLSIAIDQAETYRQLQQELAQRRANEIRLRQFERIVSATQDGIALLDQNYVYRVVNQVYLNWNQKSRDEVIGHSVADLLGADAFHHQIKPKLDRCFGGEVVQYQDWFTYGNQQRRYVTLTYSPYSDDTGQVTGVVATSRDITDLKLAQHTLLRQAKQERAINNVVRLIRQSLDIDHGDDVKDAMHRQLMQTFPGAWLVVPLKINQHTWGSLTLRKLEPGWTNESVNLATRIADQLAMGIHQAELYQAAQEVYATASMGIVMGTQAYTSATELLRDADIAMYRARANGKNGYALFDPTLHDQVMARLQIEHDLRRAIDQQQMTLYYQPIVSLRDGSIAYVEALMRWHHPDQGMISPGEFIPIAEETGLIVTLDRWALITACRQLRQWQQRFPLAQGLRISVNLSAQDLHAPDLIGDIRTALNQSGLEGRFLVIEMTESLLISDTQPVIQLMAQLQDLSVQLSVDDFGTGYSSLSYLHRFPLNALKIDQSFTSNMRQGPVNREIIETIVALTDRLGMAAIAEGGETLEQIAHLKQIGCEYSQGYHFCKPLPAADLDALLQQPYPFVDKLPPEDGANPRSGTF